MSSTTLHKSMLLGLVVLASACATPPPAVLSPQGAQVRYETKAPAVAGCTTVAQVHTDPAADSATMGTEYVDEQRTAARTRLRNEAGVLGANVVFVDEDAHPHLSDGTAYKCPTR